MTRAQRLHAYLSDMRARRFRPGEHDCGLFVAGWVMAATGEDFGAPWRGRYRSMEQLSEIMADEGYEDHIAYVASVLPALPPALAQTGDLAVVHGDALGIVSQDRVFVLRPDGLGHVSRMEAEKAFRV